MESCAPRHLPLLNLSLTIGWCAVTNVLREWGIVVNTSKASKVLAGALGAALLSTSAAQAGLLFADVGKNLEYRQTDSAGTTVPLGAANAFFFARAFYTSGAYDGGNVSFAAETRAFNSFASDCCGSTGGQYQTGYLSKASMDSQFPTGTLYTLHVTDSTSVNPPADLSVMLPGDLYTMTAIPTFDAASFSALNSLAPGAGVTIMTSTFSHDPAATAGQSFLSIFDLTGGGSVYSAFGASTRSSWLVDPGIFLAGHSYEAQLIFDNLVSSSSGGIPTTARSDLRTDLFFSLPGSVPEPGQWVLMLVGAGATGAVLRRRRTATA